MSIFRDAQQFYECVGELINRVKLDPQIGSKIAKGGVIIQFRYTEPDAMTTINAKDKPTQEGSFVDVVVELKGRFIKDWGSGGNFGLSQGFLVFEGQTVIGDHLPPGKEALGGYSDFPSGLKYSLLDWGNRVL